MDKSHPIVRPQVHADATAQNAAITEFFSIANDRVDFIEELINRGRYPEALILCVSYLDAFAQWLYWPRQGVGENFATALADYELEPFLALVHPLQFSRSLAKLKEPWKSRATVVETVFAGPDYDLMTRIDFMSAVSKLFDADELRQLESELWRGTVGAIAYELLRNPSVHTFAGNWSVGFESTYWNGAWAGLFGIDRLLPPLRAMVEEARVRSLSSGQWFGNNRIVEAT